jgi:hypothetical protein
MAPPTCIRWDRIDIGRASFPVTIDRDPVTGLERIRLGWVADEALVRRATDLLRFLDARQAELYWANPRDPASTARAQNDQRRENILNLMSRLAAQLSATTSSAKYAEILDAAEVEAATRFSYARAAPPAHGPMLAPDSERP